MQFCYCKILQHFVLFSKKATLQNCAMLEPDYFYIICCNTANYILYCTATKLHCDVTLEALHYIALCKTIKLYWIQTVATILTKLHCTKNIAKLYYVGQTRLSVQYLTPLSNTLHTSNKKPNKIALQ